MHPYSPGTEIAGYRIESLIGRGGMAFVYRAKELRLDRWVALKVLTPAFVQTAQFRERFLRESRLAASLDHPNIIPIYEAGEAEDLLYIAMRYVEGGDLHALVERKGPLTLALATTILSQAAKALDAAHARGLVHRDVKPQNILIVSGDDTTRPHVYLSDFGLMKRATSSSGVTTFGQFIGTMNYAAPEQIAYRSIDARTDLYALGCVAYQCLTGTVPFIRDDEAALLWAHMVEMPSPASSHRGELSTVDAVLAKAMAKDPADRYDSCGQFADALANRLAGSPGTAPAQATSAQPEDFAMTAPPAAAPSPPHAAAITGERSELLGRQSANPTHDGRGGGGDEGPVIPPGRDDQEKLDKKQRKRSRQMMVLIGIGVVALALLGTLISLALSSGTSNTKAGLASSQPTSASPVCQAAIAASDQALDHAHKFEAALAEHTQIMNDEDSGKISSEQAMTMGQPSLRTGASESAQFDQALQNYQQVAAQCRGGSASAAAGTPMQGGATQECTVALNASDQALGQASKVESALAEHSKVMSDFEYGRISAAQLAKLARPPLVRGASESAKFDQVLRRYPEATKQCR